MEVTDEFLNLPHPVRRVGGLGKYFNPIAGRQNHAFLHLVPCAQQLQRLRELGFGEMELFADVDWGGLVTKPYQDKVHCCMKEWALPWCRKNVNVTSTMTKPTIDIKAARRPRSPDESR